MLALMIFSTIASAAIALGSLLLERAGRMRGYPTRWLWVGALLSMLFITIAPLAGVGGRVIGSVTSSSTGAKPQEVSSSVAASNGRLSTTPSKMALARVNLISPVNQAPASSHGNASTDLLLLLLWAIASTLCAAVLAGSAWRIARMRREWRPAVVAGVPVLVSHDVGPAIIGLVHHGVVIPSWVESLSPAEQRLVLTHEREHVRAGDPLLLWGATLLAVLLPWNFASWFALRHVKHAIEMDCDARVLRDQTDAHAYCTLLLDVGERTLAGVAPIAALAEPSTLLERRVEAMTARPSPRRHSTALAVAGVVMLLLGCVAPRTQIAPQIRARELVRELNALLSSDSVVRSVPTQERAQLATKLGTGAPDAVPELRPTPAREHAMSDSERTSLLAQLDEARRTVLQRGASSEERDRALDPPVVPPQFQFSRRVDSLVRTSMPSAYAPRDDAIVVVVRFKFDGTIHSMSSQRFPLSGVFDTLPGGKLSMRDSRYLLAQQQIIGLPEPLATGATVMRDAPHAVFVWAHFGSNAF